MILLSEQKMLYKMGITVGRGIFHAAAYSYENPAASGIYTAHFFYDKFKSAVKNFDFFH